MTIDEPHPSEPVVIGRAILHSHEQPEIVARLRETDFIDPLARSVFAAIAEAQAERTAFDASMLCHLHLGIDEIHRVSEWGGIAADAHDLAWHIGKLRDARTRRALRLAASTIATNAESAETATSALADAQAEITALAIDAAQDDERKDMATLLAETVELALSTEPTASARIDSGLWSLDDASNGFPRHGLIVLAGRPGMGKSSAAITFARTMTHDPREPAVVYSPEMSPDQVVASMLAQVSGVPLERIIRRDGNQSVLTDAEAGALLSAQKTLAKYPIRISGQVRIGPHEIRAHALGVLAEPDVRRISLVVVDYLQILDVSAGARKSGGREDQEYSWASRELKLLSRELECPVILVSQINRGVEGRQDRRPRLSDLKGSGGIEENADVVLFAYRPAYYDPDTDEDDEIVIAKNRGGPLGIAPMKFSGPCVRWESM